ncbi:MAG: hypothetical protein RMK80_05045 [Pseudobdellovibrionaceae bacterium]|nr:hypothetical protein [Pseudobdellovibrionaceae bacterium]
MQLILNLFSIWNLCVAVAQVEIPGPWVDLEKNLMITRIKIQQVEQELIELNRSQKTFVTEKEKKEHIEKVRSLRQEKKEYEEAAQRLLTELRYRFPERGLRLLSITDIPISPSREGIDTNKKPDTQRSVGVIPEVEEAIQKSLATLRQQYGVPVPSEKPENISGGDQQNSGDHRGKGGTTNKKDPVFDQMILSK